MLKSYSWSYSSYSSAVRCLKLFKYVYVDRIPSATQESGDLLFGTAIHAAINASITTGNGSEVFELYWNSYKGKGIDYGRFKWEALLGIGTECLRKFDKTHAKKYDFKFGEKRLYADYKGVKLEGTPDFYGTYNGRSSLRDFKTSGYNYQPEKKDVALQLYLYAYLLLKNNIGQIETLGYTIFNKGMSSIQDMTWDFNEGEMHKALDYLVSYTEILSHGTYPKNYNSCLYPRKCDFFDRCHNKETKNNVKSN